MPVNTQSLLPNCVRSVPLAFLHSPWLKRVRAVKPVLILRLLEPRAAPAVLRERHPMGRMKRRRLHANLVLQAQRLNRRMQTAQSAEREIIR